MDSSASASTSTRPSDSANTLPTLAPLAQALERAASPATAASHSQDVNSILLGIPDRAATASAPPDLEISSRSLFAFKAGYSGIFSDIRHDDYYESFYNENPERLNLPPPLPNNDHPSPFIPQARRDIPYEHDEQPALVSQPKSATTSASASGRRPPHPSSADRRFATRPLSPRTLRADTMEPKQSSGAEPPSQEVGESRDDSNTSLDQFRPPVNVDQDAHAHAHAHSHPHSHSQHASHQRHHRTRNDAQPSSHPQNGRYVQQRQHQQSGSSQDSLWPSLHQLTLDDTDSITPHSPRRMYPTSTPYAAAPQSALRTPYDAGYVYPQPGSPLEAHIAPPLFESPPQSHWPRALPDMYEQVRYDAMVPPEYAPDELAYPARSMYTQPSASSRRANGRANGRARNSHYAYMYASRGMVPPAPSNYLDAQAAAAAAAAAAAVYKNGSVHINGTGTFGTTTNSTSTTSRIPRKSRPNGTTRMGTEYGRARADYREESTETETGATRRAMGASKLSSFNDIVGRAEELARDQHGCRFLQTKLEEGNTMYINSIFEECYEKFVDLMTDPFGNYLCQKLFEHCNDAQRLALVERCAPAFPRVSTNMHGTRAVQRMVECLSTPRQVEAVCKALAPAAVALMKDINGNHVIQRCLHRMDPAHNQFVYDAVASNCFELATHRHGCCVMQRCMDYASPAQRNQLAQQINANALPLVQNAFGNYVVQYVLGLNDPVYTGEVIRRLRGHVAELSMQKFSSNVVEKGLVQGSRELRRELVGELIEDADTMRRLLHDAYGNYVIQRALQVAESPQLEQICEAIRPHLNSLRQSPYGKRIQAKIQKRMPKCLPTSVASS